MDYQQLVEITDILKSDTEYFIEASKAKDPNFSLTKEKLNDNEREIRWHMHTLAMIEYTMSENLALKNKLKKAEETIDDLKLSNAILTNSVDLLNKRMDEETKNVADYLDDLNEGLIDVKIEMKNSSPKDYQQKEEIKNPYLNIKPPTFEGEKNSRPVQFLKALREYIDAVNLKNNEFLPLLRTCLHKNAKTWLYVIDKKINNFDDFEVLFKERFWNEPIKSKLYSRFEMGKWTRDSNKPRVIYAQEIIAYAQELELRITEGELIKKIGRHFLADRVIPTSIRMQNIDNFGKLFDLLQECDNDEEAYKERMAKKNQNKGSQNTKNEQKTSNSSNSDPQSQKMSDNQSQGNKKGNFPQSTNFHKNNQNNNYGNKNRNYNNNKQSEPQSQIQSIEMVNTGKKQKEKAKDPVSEDSSEN